MAVTEQSQNSTAGRVQLEACCGANVVVRNKMAAYTVHQQRDKACVGNKKNFKTKSF